MSAIAGVYYLDKYPKSDNQIFKMMEMLDKYPADDIQVWQQDNISFGCHAQWNTPESVGEKLPCYDYQKQYAITADAIIDNRQELAVNLGLDKQQLKLLPDSMLILLAYDKWEEETPQYLIGDFAFMIWDGKRQKLFGARDFSGGRTLYYSHKKGEFAFCTLMEPLLTNKYISKELNEDWLSEYLAISGAIDTTDASITPYRDVAQLPPAHSITVTKDSLRVRKYINLSAKSELFLGSDREYVEAFQSIFQEAVHARLRSKGLVGAQLSGGLDSGAVVSFAAKELKKKSSTQKLHTFSYIPPKDFKDFTPSYLIADETPYIQSTVKHVGGIQDHYLDFQGSNSYRTIDELLEVLEMPYKFFENSFWLNGIFQKAQEEKLSILLSGERGNLSISWGSAFDYYLRLFKQMRWLKLNNELTQHTKRNGGSNFKKLSVIGREALRGRNREIENYPVLINPDFASRTSIYEKLRIKGMDRTGWYTSKVKDERSKHFEDEFQWNTTNSLATKLSLKYGVWKRDPTNDLRVIRFCLSIPESQFVNDGLDRALIRRSTKDYLPDKVRLNQRVRGVQGADWVHRMVDDWPLFVEEITAMSRDGQVMEYLNKKAILTGLEKIKAGPNVELDTDLDYRILMRSLIFYRFLKKLI
ncbi:asparagine synthase-related protein [Niallia taxi]|uniref:asparagine synthase-related protein n=1 Tax=Niallia taxi TaxID=2499688 RepID=UPI003981DDCD